MTEVLRYARYMGPGSESVYNYVEFCGACRQKLGGSYDGPLMERPYHPEDLEAECESAALGRSSWTIGEQVEYEYWSYCPFCGTAFDAEWWRNQPIRNKRIPDHFTNPGTHAGDSHLIEVDDHGQHLLGSTDPTFPCWCEPEITPGPMGCEVRHRHVSHGTPHPT